MSASIGWEQHFCPTVFCEALVLYVQKYNDDPERWLIRVNNRVEVRMMADLTCPICGKPLLDWHLGETQASEPELCLN